MNCLKAIAKIEKALGIKVEVNERGNCWFQYENQIGSFFPNGTNSLEGEITCMRVRSVNDEDDPYTDYCAGYFVSNVTQLIHACKPPESKFKAGFLVRGKSNKRATRQGYAGKVGLVTEAKNKYVNVRWVGETDAEVRQRFNMSYPERDLELVSG